MDKNTRNTIIGAIGLGLAVTYVGPQLSSSNPRKANDPHPTIAEIDPDFPSIVFKVRGMSGGFGGDDREAMAYIYNTIPFQLVSPTGYGRNAATQTSAALPSFQDMSEIIRKTKRVVLFGANVVDAGRGNPSGDETFANRMISDGLLPLQNIHELQYGPYYLGPYNPFGDRVLEAPQVVLMESVVKKVRLVQENEQNGLFGTITHTTKTIHYNEEGFSAEANNIPYMTLIIDPKTAKINADRWPQVEAVLRGGTSRPLGVEGEGDLNIMLTDDETFRCYIPIANKTSSHIYYSDPANEGVTSNETRIPGGDLNDPLRFKQYSQVEHRHYAKTVFLLPYAYRTDDTLASVYENVFDRSMSQ